MILALRTIKICDNHTLFECIQSREWMDYLFDLKSEPPKKDLLNLLFRLAAQNKIEPRLDSFIDIIEHRDLDEYGKEMNKLFILWKIHEAQNELRRAKLVFSYITLKGYYPECARPLMNETNSDTQKAQQIFDLMDLWCDKAIRRIFFMFVFKFCKKSTKQKFNKHPRTTKDLDYIIYEQASNGLWDYIEHIEEECLIVKCSNASKKRVRPKKIYEEWIHWMNEQGGKYIDVIAYAEKYYDKSRRVRVFSEFISIYLGSNARATISRIDTRWENLDSFKIIPKNADQSMSE